MPASTSNTLTSNQNNLITTPLQSTVTVDSNIAHLSNLPSSTVIATTSSSVTPNIQAIGKPETVKQINICVAPGLSNATNLSNVSGNVTVAAAPVPANAAKYQAQTVSTNYYNANNSVITTSATSIPVGTLQSLGLMVTRFASDPSSRHQTVLTLHPRAVNPNTRGNVVVTSSTGVGQTIRAVTSLPLNSGARTATGGHSQLATQGSTIQVMNLSVTNPSGATLGTSGGSTGYTTGTVKQICQPAGRFITSTVPIESLELVVTNDATTGRPLRIPSDVNIVNVKSASTTGASVISNNTGATHGVAKLTRTSLVTNNQTGKMINIHTTGHATNAGLSPQVTRLGIIGQIPTSAVVSTASGTKSIINTLTLTSKPLQILNPSANVNSSNILNTTGATPGAVHGVVNLSNVSQISTGPIVTSGNTISSTVSSNQLRSNPTVMTLANLAQTRQVLTTTQPLGQNTFLTAQHQQQAKLAGNISVTHHQQQPQQQQQQQISLSNSLTIATPTSIRPTILSSSPMSSPVKQPNTTQLTIPSSPRPSILIRKKIVSELSGNKSGQNINITVSNNSNTVNSSICKIVSSKNLSNCINASPSALTDAAAAAASKVTLNNINNKRLNDSRDLETSTNKQLTSLSLSSSTVATSSSFTSSSAANKSATSTTVITATALNSSTVLNSVNDSTTPRKKPRKQLLEPFNLSTSVNIKLLSGSSSSSSIDEQVRQMSTSSTSTASSTSSISHYLNHNQLPGERELNQEIREGIITICKKPRPSLLPNYNSGWKSLQYHFLRYSDVKQKPEKKQTLSELSNEGIQRKNGWKIHHLGTQMDDVIDNEVNIYDRLNILLDHFEPNAQYCIINDLIGNEQDGKSNVNDSLNSSSANIGCTAANSSNNNNNNSNNENQYTTMIIEKLNDLIKGNLQRSHLFQEQISESKQLLIKLTNDHKERVGKLTKKCANKRTFITK